MGAIIRLDAPRSRAYVAEPRGEPAARVLIIPDAYGLLPHVRFMCDELADVGFVAMVPDLHQGSSAKSAREAERLREQLSLTHAERVLAAALRGFAYMGHVESPRAAIGFSMGAGFAFGLAARGDAQAAVAYYGVPRAEDRVRIRTPVLIHWAETDEWPDQDSPQRIVAALEQHGASVEEHTYPGTRHSFANADLEAFDLDAAEAAWQTTVEFLRRTTQSA